MVWVPGGEFLMGSDDFYPEERPVHRVAVDGFWMDEHPVTVAEFRGSSTTTGYVTVAERPLDPADYPDADPELLVPGSLVFRKTDAARSTWTTTELVAWRARARTGGTRPGPAARSTASTGTRSSHVAWETPSLRRVGGQGAADRGRMGVRRPRRARGRGLRLG